MSPPRRSVGDHRFVGEAVVTTEVVALLGTPDQWSRAEELLATMAASPDPVIGTLARWSLAHPPTPDQLREIAEQG